MRCFMIKSTIRRLNGSGQPSVHLNDSKLRGKFAILKVLKKFSNLNTQSNQTTRIFHKFKKWLKTSDFRFKNRKIENFRGIPRESENPNLVAFHIKWLINVLMPMLVVAHILCFVCLKFILSWTWQLNRQIIYSKIESTLEISYRRFN